jgi:hypothetical protein
MDQHSSVTESITAASSKPKRTGLIIAGVIVLIAVLAGAAFISGRYLTAPKAANGSIFGGASIRPARATELPAADPDAVGLVVKREDNTISIGTHVVKFHTVRDASGQIVNREAGYDGPVIAVVITHDTLIYRDVTPIGQGQPAGNGVIQQTVQTSSLDEIDQQTLLQVWGERQGDRIVARVLLIMSLPS